MPLPGRRRVAGVDRVHHRLVQGGGDALQLVETGVLRLKLRPLQRGALDVGGGGKARLRAAAAMRRLSATVKRMEVGLRAAALLMRATL